MQNIYLIDIIYHQRLSTLFKKKWTTVTVFCCLVVQLIEPNRDKNGGELDGIVVEDSSQLVSFMFTQRRKCWNLLNGSYVCRDDKP